MYYSTIVIPNKINNLAALLYNSTLSSDENIPEESII